MPIPRRRFVQSAVAGSLLMPGLLSELLAAESSDPLAPKKPHLPAKAKAVIFLFMSGGVSHVDSFDPKPKLIADHGKQVTFDHPETRNRPGYEKLFLKKPNWKFVPRGKSGIEVSDLFPHLGKQIDDIAMIRSMHTSHSNHYNATLGMHTGSFAFARPSIGAWTTSPSSARCTRATRTTTTPRSACTPAPSRSPDPVSARGRVTASGR